MVFFVYLDPAVVRQATAAGELGWGVLVAMLRAATQNCVVLDFEDYRWESGIKREVDSTDPSFDRALVKTLLATLLNRHCVVPCFKDDYAGRQELQLVVEQATEAELDCIVGSTPLTLPEGCPAETTTLSNYQFSQFEKQRAETAAYGREYSGGELDSARFLRSNFRKLLRYAARIEVCDAVLGRKFGNNFRHGLKRFLELVCETSAEQCDCHVLIHCEKSERTPDLHSEIERLQRKLPSRIRLEVQLYSSPSKTQCLPHERYLWTDQFALEIGRGMDPVDPQTDTNRDVSLSLKELRQVRAKVDSYSKFRYQADRESAGSPPRPR